ncbi:MAG TPA: S-methyl-5-thioribose-1-phosphate isomerase [Lachnospiraceae bacterium]|nr:S-methyl-5-thioribose-1-phosphate isomerase [Lachnospiraceae bacterium]
MSNILDIETVALDEEKKALVIIDQTRLPYETKLLYLTELKEIWDAIYLLKVRGAPAIGVAAAIGIYAYAEHSLKDRVEDFSDAFKKACDYLNSARPTAVNLSWALGRMLGMVEDNKGLPVEELLQRLHDEALLIKEEDIAMCRRIGEYGLSFIREDCGVLTHCNAGQLATSKYGTATAPMYLAHERGMSIRVYCDETRPLLQGARLTSYELSSAGLDVTLLCDNMAGAVMKEGLIDAVFVGCDRVAANGDTANKIGTSSVAVLAAYYKIPFYVCAPSSTIDADTPTGDGIRIEQRPESEVTEMWYKKRMAPENIKVYNPAFDVTDHSLITAIITERGIYYPPYDFRHFR